jgi:ribosome-associated translation inhibitor RaiA
MTIQVTTEIRKEIENSINEFDRLIKKEMSFSVDLRKHDKIVLYTNKIVELQKALTDGVL